MLLSVLIPIYNAEPFIERCVRSLMEQTITSGVEYIFINDASSDHSIDILEKVIAEYPERRNQVQIIHHPKNQGIALTRTQAIQVAKGEYIGWCDSDDWCEPDMFRALLEKACQENADIVTCGYICELEKESHKVLRQYPSLGKEYLEKLYTCPDTFCSLCDKIAKRSLYSAHGISPFPDVNVSEDMNVMYRLFYYAQRVCVVPSFYYHINSIQHPSISHGKDRKYIFQQDYRNNALICEFLQSKDCKKYQLSCSYLKFLTKIVSKDIFSDSRQYYRLYHETHRDILKFSGKPLLLRLKLALCFSSYPMFRICYALVSLRDRIQK